MRTHARSTSGRSTLCGRPAEGLRTVPDHDRLERQTDACRKCLASGLTYPIDLRGQLVHWRRVTRTTPCGLQVSGVRSSPDARELTCGVCRAEAVAQRVDRGGAW